MPRIDDKSLATKLVTNPLIQLLIRANSLVVSNASNVIITSSTYFIIAKLFTKLLTKLLSIFNNSNIYNNSDNDL